MYEPDVRGNFCFCFLPIARSNATPLKLTVRLTTSCSPSVGLHGKVYRARRGIMSTTPQKNQVIYSMIGVGKYYDKKPVLKDIYLSYFYGAKIGVIGLNGSGKSSLLRILAGVDTEFVGQTVLSPGHTVGFLEQEPRLDESKT